MSRAAAAPQDTAARTVPVPGIGERSGTIGECAGGWARAWPFLCAAALYLAISLVAWWHLLAQVGSALPAGSADPGQEVWFLAWVPHALGSGTNPFFSHAIFFRQGVNLLDNTSMELLGLLLAPVTVTAGPVASLDVAVLLAPVLSALGAFALCRRYVRWSVSAFAGGLCYGFGPFLAGDLRYAHLDLTWLLIPPLIFCCLDALVVRGTRRPVLVGGLLGILVVAQFFVSTEMLAITTLTAAAVAIALCAGWPRAVLPKLAAARSGLALATAIVAIALAYPLWVVVAGPRHVVGPVWHHIGRIATSLAATVEPHGELTSVSFISGSNGSYLGVALLAVLLAGAVLLWRSPVLRVCLVTAAVTYVASLGYELHVGHRMLHVPLPAAVLGHLPLLDSVVPERFAAMVDLFLGLALAVVVDHVRAWERPPSRSRSPRRALTSTIVTAGSRRRAPSRPLLDLLAITVGALGLAPFAAIPRWPYAVTPVARPPSLRAHVSSRAVSSDRPVVAIYPDTASWVSEAMVWQAQDGFSFVLPDGYAIVPGKGRHAVEAPPTDALWLVFAAGSVHRLLLPLTPTTRAAVRGDLRALGVDEVVVLPGTAGSSAVREALRETLGPPEGGKGGAAFWRAGADGRSPTR